MFLLDGCIIDFKSKKCFCIHVDVEYNEKHKVTSIDGCLKSCSHFSFLRELSIDLVRDSASDTVYCNVHNNLIKLPRRESADDFKISLTRSPIYSETHLGVAAPEGAEHFMYLQHQLCCHDVRMSDVRAYQTDSSDEEDYTAVYVSSDSSSW